MSSRQIIVPGQQDDVKPHEHEASDVTGVYGFFRALKAIIDGSMTVNGTLRVASGADVIIGDAASSNSQLFIDNIQSHLNLRETDDASYPDKIFIMDVNGGIARLVWRDQTGAPVSTDLLHFNQNGSVEAKVALHLPNGLEATPGLAFENDTTTGFFRDAAGQIAVSSGGAEVARFTTAGLRGLEAVTDTEPNSRTFTNTSFLDLDALTGGSGTITAVAATVTTGTRALVTISAQLQNDTLNAVSLLSYRVSGATTVAASDDWSALARAAVANDATTVTRSRIHTGLTAGSNTFEVQARVTGGTGTILRIDLTVVPLL